MNAWLAAAALVVFAGCASPEPPHLVLAAQEHALTVQEAQPGLTWAMVSFTASPRYCYASAPSGVLLEGQVVQVAAPEGVRCTLTVHYAGATVGAYVFTFEKSPEPTTQ